MATSWRIGAFADRCPGSALEIGRSYALASRAARALHDSAGTAPESSFAWPGMVCCREEGGAIEECASGSLTCCTSGTCSQCRPDHDDFETLYPEPEKILDAAHAFQAAVLDILADPDVEDVGAALSEAATLHQGGLLLALYQPAPPARTKEDGELFPARCPICGAFTCEACGCVCECADAGSDAPAQPEEPAGEGE